MHDIWSPWHGCTKISEGCEHCYMYFLDKVHGNKLGSVIYKTKNMRYPLQRNRDGSYKVKSGEMIRVCMSSDFFLEEADAWREEAWDIMRERKDVVFFILTKRAERILECLPKDWGDGWENIFLNVTCENQKRADERIPVLLSIPAKHKGIMCAPFIGPISIEPYLKTGELEQVIVGGENYDGSRSCDFSWVQSLHKECVKYNVKFCFIETGTKFIKDGKMYTLKDKELQARMAYKSNMNFEGKRIEWKLYDEFLNPIKKEEVYHPFFWSKCHECGSKPICNGCSRCGKCEIKEEKIFF